MNVEFGVKVHLENGESLSINIDQELAGYLELFAIGYNEQKDGVKVKISLSKAEAKDLVHALSKMLELHDKDLF